MSNISRILKRTFVTALVGATIATMYTHRDELDKIATINIRDAHPSMMTAGIPVSAQIPQQVAEKPQNDNPSPLVASAQPDPIIPKKANVEPVKKLPYYEKDGVKYDTLMHELKSAKLVDVPFDIFNIKVGSGESSLIYFMPIFYTSKGYIKLGTAENYGLARGLIYNVEYRRFYKPKTVNYEQLFHSMWITDSKLAVTADNVSNIEGIIRNIELVNERQK